jgi:hypothetical protein
MNQRGGIIQSSSRHVAVLASTKYFGILSDRFTPTATK